MKRFSFMLALLAALVLPVTAVAKGPDRASISGPGLGKTIVLAGSGESMQSPLGTISQLTGFFPAAYQEIPDPMLKRAPTRDLGPKYVIHYRVPGPNNTTYRIDQDLYPYARGGAITYMKPGQRIFTGHTYGGWFLGGPQLKLALQHHGLPAHAPGASGTNAGLVAGIAVPGALALVAIGLLYRRRREQA